MNLYCNINKQRITDDAGNEHSFEEAKKLIADGRVTDVNMAWHTLSQFNRDYKKVTWQVKD